MVDIAAGIVSVSGPGDRHWAHGHSGTPLGAAADRVLDRGLDMVVGRYARRWSSSRSCATTDNARGPPFSMPRGGMPGNEAKGRLPVVQKPAPSILVRCLSAMLRRVG